MLKKLTSGRYVLTLMAGFAFVWVTIKGILPPEAVSAIISMVFISYFQKGKNNVDRQPN